MSATHSSFGRLALKSRRTRSLVDDGWKTHHRTIRDNLEVKEVWVGQSQGKAEARSCASFG
jgi:hypothetical protein